MARTTMLDGPTRGTFRLSSAYETTTNADANTSKPTASTPADSQEQAHTASAESQHEAASALLPKSGTTYIIRCISSGEVIAMLDGEVTLAHSNTPGSIEWVCVEKNGVYGFRNRAAGTYLGHNGFRQLRSWATWHRAWENFKLWPRPGGVLMTMDYWWSDLPVGLKMIKEQKKLGMLDFDDAEQMIWEFVEV